MFSVTLCGGLFCLLCAESCFVYSVQRAFRFSVQRAGLVCFFSTAAHFGSFINHFGACGRLTFSLQQEKVSKKCRFFALFEKPTQSYPKTRLFIVVGSLTSAKKGLSGETECAVNGLAVSAGCCSVLIC